MATGGTIGVELFEFANAGKPENKFEYWKTGVFHFCVQDPDVAALARRIVENGGKQRMPLLALRACLVVQGNFLNAQEVWLTPEKTQFKDVPPRS